MQYVPTKRNQKYGIVILKSGFFLRVTKPVLLILNKINETCQYPQLYNIFPNKTYGNFLDKIKNQSGYHLYYLQESIPYSHNSVMAMVKLKMVKRVVCNRGRQAALFTAFTILVNDVCEPIEKILIPTSLHIWPGDCQLVSYPVYHLPFCEHTRELG